LKKENTLKSHWMQMQAHKYVGKKQLQKAVTAKRNLILVFGKVLKI
jgi:hypothetical protein